MMVNSFSNKPWFLLVCSTCLCENTVGKGEIARNSVFYWCGTLSAIFLKNDIVVCKLFQFGRVQNLLFGKGLKNLKGKKNCFQTLMCDCLCNVYTYQAISKSF